MSSPRIFWLSLGVFGVTVLLRSVSSLISGDSTVSLLVSGVSGLGILFIAVYGTLRPDEVGGPSTERPLTYCAVLAAILSAVGLGLRVV